MGCLFGLGQAVARACFGLGAFLAAILARGLGFLLLTIVGPLLLGSMRELLLRVTRATNDGRSARSRWQLGSRTAYAILSGLAWAGGFLLLSGLWRAMSWLFGQGWRVSRQPWPPGCPPPWPCSSSSSSVPSSARSRIATRMRASVAFDAQLGATGVLRSVFRSLLNSAKRGGRPRAPVGRPRPQYDALLMGVRMLWSTTPCGRVAHPVATYHPDGWGADGSRGATLYAWAFRSSEAHA